MTYRPIPFAEGPPAPGLDRIDSDVILRVSKQLLSAVASLHERGIAHGGKSIHILLERSPQVTFEEPAAH